MLINIKVTSATIGADYRLRSVGGGTLALTKRVLTRVIREILLLYSNSVTLQFLSYRIVAEWLKR